MNGSGVKMSQNGHPQTLFEKVWNQHIVADGSEDMHARCAVYRPASGA